MSKSTLYSEACNQVAGFQQMGEEFTRKLVINNKAKSTHENYLRQMAKLAIYYKRSPLDLEVGELEEYLYYLIQKDTDSLSSYKHLVYGLRKLSTQEVISLLKAPERLQEKVMFALTYGHGNAH